MENTFNPHGNKTSNGVTVVVGMRVRDYDYREGVVVMDRTLVQCEHGHCRDDHWFDVKRDDGTVKEFNGTRLFALEGWS